MAQPGAAEAGVRGPRPALNAAVDKVLRDPESFLRDAARPMKNGRSSTVGGASGLVLKRFNFRKPLNLLKDLFRRSPARRAFLMAYHLELAGIPPTRAVACAEERIGPFVKRGFFLTEEIVGAVELGKWRGARRAAVRPVAEPVARLRQEGFSHRNLKERNLLLDPQGRSWLIDLEGLQFERQVSPERAAVARVHGGGPSAFFEALLPRAFLRAAGAVPD